MAYLCFKRCLISHLNINTILLHIPNDCTSTISLSYVIASDSLETVGNYRGSEQGVEIWRVPEDGHLSRSLKGGGGWQPNCNGGGPRAEVRRGTASTPVARLALLPRKTSLRTHLLPEVSTTAVAVLSQSLISSLQGYSYFPGVKQPIPKLGFTLHSPHQPPPQSLNNEVL